MIKKIVLENFMIHKRTELELGPGVTALTGPNNNGKSAIVEALRCVATNPRHSLFIRHGSKEARVSVEMDDGAKVVWIRKKKSAGYEITLPGKAEPEEQFWKLQGRVPEEVRKILRLDLVDLETGRTVDVHVGNQREPVFLLRSDSDVAAFFAASTESAHLLAMQNLLKRRTAESKRRERELEERLSQIKSGLDRLARLPDIDLQMKRARELEQTAKISQAGIPILEKVLASQHALSGSLDTKTTSATILKTVDSPPKLSKVSALEGFIRHLESLNRKQSMAVKGSAALAPLAEPPKVFDTPLLIDVQTQLKAAADDLRKAEVRSSSLHALSEPPAMEEADHLSGMIDQILTIRCRSNRLYRWQKILRNVVEPPAVQTGDGLVQTVADIRGMSLRLDRAQHALKDLESRLETVEDDIAACIDSLGCCPTCGGELKTEEFLDRGCRHDA